MSDTGYETAAFNYYTERFNEVKKHRKEGDSFAWMMTRNFKSRVDCREELIRKHGLDATFHLTHAVVNEILDEELATAFKLRYG